MASSSRASSFGFAWVILVLAVLCIASTSAADINGICTKTMNPPFCLKVLISIGGGHARDLKILAKNTINTGISNATRTLIVIKSLVGQATDPQLKSKLSSCTDSYIDVIDQLHESAAALSTGDYQGANIRASAAMTDAGDCQDVIGSAAPRLSTNNENLKSICSIILRIVNIIGGLVV